VISESVISVNNGNTGDKWGRSHSLWFCDAHEKDRFAWYEVAFWEMRTHGAATAYVSTLRLPDDAMAMVVAVEQPEGTLLPELVQWLPSAELDEPIGTIGALRETAMSRDVTALISYLSPGRRRGAIRSNENGQRSRSSRDRFARSAARCSRMGRDPRV
jgi:hypothetical protein